VKIHTVVFWVLNPCRLVHNYQYFRATYYLHLQCRGDGTFLENGIKLLHHMSQTRRPQYEKETVLKRTLFSSVIIYVLKGKAVPLQAWSGPEGSRKLRFLDFLTTEQDGGKVVSLLHRPPLTPRNSPGTHFCYRMSRPLGHSAIGRILCQWKIPIPATF